VQDALCGVQGDVYTVYCMLCMKRGCKSVVCVYRCVQVLCVCVGVVFDTITMYVDKKGNSYSLSETVV
jgi:hypothetical protein